MWNVAENDEPTGICERSARSFPTSYLMCSEKHRENRNQKHRRIARQMTRVKVLAAKSEDDLNADPGTFMVEGKS